MSQIEPAIRRKAELFGTIFGLLGGVFSARNESSTMALFTIGASILAGAVGNYLSGADDDPGLRPRAGIRAGVVAALVSGATAIACFTLKAGGFAAVKIIPALLAIPPGAFFGLLGSLIVSMIQNPQVRPMGQWEPKERSRPSALLVVILLASAIGYLSPFIAVMMPARKAPVVELPALPLIQPTPSPTPEPRPVVVPPPPWKYQPPADFANARPSQLKVQREASLGRFDSPLRFAFLDDERHLAFVRPDNSVARVNLTEPETVSVFPIPESPERFAFSRDLKKVFCVGNRGGIFVSTVDGAVRLPLPVSAPAGTIVWDSEREIFIGTQRLDLETLRLLPSPEVTPSPAQPHSKIRLRPTGRLLSVEDNSLRAVRQFFFRDEKRDYAVLASFRVDAPILSADATKLFYIRDGELFVGYLETGPSRETKFTATMPESPPAAISDALNSRALVAMLCAPVVNPLNGKTVGADLTRIKALIGIESWTDTIATMWLKEDYGELPRTSDVVAFIGKIENGRTVPLPQFAEWWSPIADVKSGDAPERIAPVVPKEPPRPEIPPQTAQRETPQQRDAQLPRAIADRVRAFVEEHHAKSSRYDIAGLVADYAESVDHLNGTLVSREKIRADEEKSHRPGTLTEKVVGPIQVTRVSENEVRATYTIRFDQRLQVGSWANGFSDLDLTIDIRGPSPLITRQRARNYEVKKGP